MGHQGQWSSNVATSRICEDLCWNSASVHWIFAVRKVGGVSHWNMLSTAVVAQASRIDDTHEEKLRFLMRAHEIDDFDDMIRKTLVKQLHHSIAQETRPILGRSDGSRGVFTMLWRKDTFFTWSLQATLWPNSALLHCEAIVVSTVVSSSFLWWFNACFAPKKRN